jgi:protein TonB
LGAALGTTVAMTARPAAPPSGAAAPSPAASIEIPARPIMGAIPPPAYPQAARRRGEQGRVLVRVQVSPDGSPAAVSVAASSGSASLDDAALAAVRAARFTPATRNGTPVAGAAEVPIVFRLE